jgi:hypothetical protein
VPEVRAPVRRGGDAGGGGCRYPSDWLHEEVAYLAYHLHWGREEILGLEHAERRRWVAEVAAINRRLEEEADER